MEEVKWQPMMLIVNKRIECECGTLAIFISGKVVDNENNSLEEVNFWCQACFGEKAQEEADESV